VERDRARYYLGPHLSLILSAYSLCPLNMVCLLFSYPKFFRKRLVNLEIIVDAFLNRASRGHLTCIFLKSRDLTH